MTSRPLTEWRHYPTLRVREAAELVGVCVRTFEQNVLPKLDTREVGRTRLVLTDSLRRWLGEDVEAQVEAEAVSARARRNAERLLKRVR